MFSTVLLPPLNHLRSVRQEAPIHIFNTCSCKFVIATVGSHAEGGRHWTTHESDIEQHKNRFVVNWLKLDVCVCIYAEMDDFRLSVWLMVIAIDIWLIGGPSLVWKCLCVSFSRVIKCVSNWYAFGIQWGWLPFFHFTWNRVGTGVCGALLIHWLGSSVGWWKTKWNLSESFLDLETAKIRPRKPQERLSLIGRKSIKENASANINC